MQIIKRDNYRVSPRVLLTCGDRFRARGGPYWRLKDGTKVSIKSSGPYVFHAHCTRGAVEWIECLDRDACFAVLHISGRRRRIDASLVTRPYKITGKTRKLKIPY